MAEKPNQHVYDMDLTSKKDLEDPRQLAGPSRRSASASSTQQSPMVSFDAFLPLRLHLIASRLHTEPKSLAHPEEACKAEVHICCDGTPTEHDLVYYLSRYSERLGEGILAKPHRSEELFNEYLAGRRDRDLVT